MQGHGTVRLQMVQGRTSCAGWLCCRAEEQQSPYEEKTLAVARHNLTRSADHGTSLVRTSSSKTSVYTDSCSIEWFRDDAPVEPVCLARLREGLAAGSNWLMARIVSIAPSPSATPTFPPSKLTTFGVRPREPPGTRVFVCQRSSVHPHVRAKRAAGAVTSRVRAPCTSQVRCRFTRANREQEKRSIIAPRLARRPRSMALGASTRRSASRCRCRRHRGIWP